MNITDALKITYQNKTNDPTDPNSINKFFATEANEIKHRHNDVVEALKTSSNAVDSLGTFSSLVVLTASYPSGPPNSEWALIQVNVGDTPQVAQWNATAWEVVTNVQSVQFFTSESDRPNPGQESVLYISKGEKSISYWDSGQYHALNSGNSSIIDAREAGGDSTGIQAAIDSATGTSITLYFPPGEYTLTSQISIWNRFKHIKVYGDNAILKPTLEDNEDLFRIGSNSSQTTPIIYPEIVEFSGINFDFTNTTNTIEVSALLFDTVLGKLNISKCIFFNFKNHNTNGLELLSIGNNPTLGNNNTYPGFSITNCAFWNPILFSSSATEYDYLDNNTFGQAIVLGDLDANASEYWTITNNGFSNIRKVLKDRSGANGIFSHNTISYCNPIIDITDLNHGIIELDDTTDNFGKITISDNKINHSWGIAIYSTGVSDTNGHLIKNNDFLVNAYTPIRIAGSGRTKITHNNFNRVGVNGGLNRPAFFSDRFIIVTACNRTRVQINEFYGNADYAVAFSAGLKGNVIKDNIYSDEISPNSGVTDGFILGISNGVDNNEITGNIKTPATL